MKDSENDLTVDNFEEKLTVARFARQWLDVKIKLSQGERSDSNWDEDRPIKAFVTHGFEGESVLANGDEHYTVLIDKIMKSVVNQMKKQYELTGYC